MPEELVVTGNEEGKGIEHSAVEDAAFLAEGEETDKEELEEKETVEKEEPEKEEEKEEEVVEDETKDQVKTRPAFKAITAKYPNLFKDFPDLREMYFREQAYTKEFPTVEDAKEAVETVEKFNVLDEMISAGTIEKAVEFFAAIKESDLDIHDKFVHNFMPALSKHDPDAYFEILTPISQDLIRAVYSEGQRLNNKDLMNSAMHFANYYFNDKDIATGTKSVPVRKMNESNPEKEKFEKEKEDFYSKQFDTAQNTVESSINGRLNAELSKSFETDFNEYMTRTLTKEAKTEIDALITKDADHMARMKSLWKQAKDRGFSKESLDRISSAYLSRARQILPEVRNKIRSNALSDKKDKSDKDLENSKKNSRRDITSGGEQRFSSKVTDPKKIDYSKTSDMDILNDRVTLRK